MMANPSPPGETIGGRRWRVIIKILLAVLMISAVVVVWACIRISAVENEMVAAQLEDAKRAKEEALQCKAEAEKICEELRKAIKEEIK